MDLARWASEQTPDPAGAVAGAQPALNHTLALADTADESQSAQMPTMRSLFAAARAEHDRGVRGADTDALLARVRGLALRYARARLAPFAAADTAQDVAQEVCLAVLASMDTFTDRGAPFEAFVFGISARKVADVQRRVLRSPEFVDQVPERVDESGGPESRVIAADEVARMSGLLATLPTVQREIITLRVAVGLSAEETGAALQMTPGAVRVAQHRALAALRALLVAQDAGVA